MSDYDFYDARSEASLIKARIVSKYFRFWTKIMVPRVKGWGDRLAYIDLFAGPGRYKDGTPLTAILVLEEVLQNPDLCKMLVSLFNDENYEFTEQLRKNIEAIEGIGKLLHKPKISTGEVDEKFEEFFSKLTMVPSFSFIDPFGYKGITLKLLRGMLKDWGCDLVLFFSYNRVNAAIDNDNVPLDFIQAVFKTMNDTAHLPGTDETGGAIGGARIAAFRDNEYLDGRERGEC